MGHCGKFNNVEMMEDRLGQYCDPPIINHEFSPWNDFLFAFNHLDVFHLPHISRLLLRNLLRIIVNMESVIGPSG